MTNDHAKHRPNESRVPGSFRAPPSGASWLLSGLHGGPRAISGWSPPEDPAIRFKCDGLSHNFPINKYPIPCCTRCHPIRRGYGATKGEVPVWRGTHSRNLRALGQPVLPIPSNSPTFPNIFRLLGTACGASTEFTPVTMPSSTGLTSSVATHRRCRRCKLCRQATATAVFPGQARCARARPPALVSPDFG
jgi:hypothetical protein